MEREVSYRKKKYPQVLAVGDQDSHTRGEICSKTHTHHCGVSVRQAPRTQHKKKNTTLVEFKRNSCSLCCFLWASFYHSPHKICPEKFFLPLEHTHKFSSTLEFLALKVWMFVATLPMSKKYLQGKKKNLT